MAYLTIENAPEIMKRVAEFTSTIRSTKGEKFRVIVSSDSVRVIAGQDALEKFQTEFSPQGDYQLFIRTSGNMPSTSLHISERLLPSDYFSPNAE